MENWFFLRKFLTIESPLKLITNAFYSMLNALFVLEIIIFLSRLFGYLEKRLDKKAVISFNIYNVTDWTTNNYNTHITQYLKKFEQFMRYSMRNIFLQKSCKKWDRETSPRPRFVFKKAIYKVTASVQHLSFNIFW